MSPHVVVGSGPIGTTIARLLADRGESVRMITRSGGGPEHKLIERVAADAADTRRLIELTAGAEVLYNCANPKYTDWEQKWFPMNDAMIAAAKATDAVYAITGNLYVYGPQPGGYMREDTPMAAVGRKGKVRRKMWRDALASGVRTVEARGSDYIGAGAVGIFSFALLPAVAKGRAAWVPADPDAPLGEPRVRPLQRHAARDGRDGLPVLLPVPPRQRPDRPDLRPDRHSHRGGPPRNGGRRRPDRRPRDVTPHPEPTGGPPPSRFRLGR